MKRFLWIQKVNQGSSLKKVEIQRMYDDYAVLSVGVAMAELIEVGHLRGR